MSTWGYKFLLDFDSTAKKKNEHSRGLKCDSADEGTLKSAYQNSQSAPVGFFFVYRLLLADLMLFVELHNRIQQDVSRYYTSYLG